MQRYFGFTLIELMIGILVMSLVLCFSMPFYRNTRASKEETLFKEELIVLLATTKLQAFLMGSPLILEPLYRASDGAWQKGIRCRTTDGATRYQWQWPPIHASVRWFGFQGSDAILVSPYPHQLAMNGYFEVDKTLLIVNRFGRVRVDT